MVWLPDLVEDRVLGVAVHQVARELRLRNQVIWSFLSLFSFPTDLFKLNNKSEKENLTSVVCGSEGVKRKMAPDFCSLEKVSKVSQNPRMC